MLREETIDKINKTVAVCNRHKIYLLFALEQNSALFPVAQYNYDFLTQIQISFIDQMIFRFSKLQDSIGNRLFINLLEFLGEDTETMAFKDVLSKLEKLRAIPSAGEWMELREIRNIVSHEYPDDTDRLIAGLNLLYIKARRLLEIYSGLIEFLNKSLPLQS